MHSSDFKHIMESYQKQGGVAGTINPRSAKSVHCETCAEGKPDVDAGGRGGRRERAGDRGEGPVRGRCLPLQTGRDSGLERGQVYLFAGPGGPASEEKGQV